ncbi:MFS general substrate transporter [Myriangium duriaei CBS 260.36]|uniref:MFS general substrate transporter n=1 Tax=Myriangium duriaei CBS 260.36 TaxID=1168546 RepID=A0A9P4MHH7_9PEZI|nr:MFS general substrate transporter [Myriangium duriaei CBS 260.36]
MNMQRNDAREEAVDQAEKPASSTDSSSVNTHNERTNQHEEDIEHHHAELTKTNTRRSVKSFRQSLKTSAPQEDSNDTDSIPDGGLVAWLHVLGSFFLFFNNWGIINAFGVYQTYYMTTLLTNETPASIAWIGSVQSFILDFVGPMMGPIYDAGYFRPLILVGSFLVVFGHMMLSLCTTYWQVFLSQAVCVGLGAGCLYVPGVAILSTYFKRNIGAATGLAAAGSSMGGVIYPIVLYNLIPKIGFGWATRVIAFISLSTLIVSNTVMRPRVIPSGKRKIVDLPSLKEPPYVLFVLGGLVSFAGLYPPFVYIQSFAQDKKLMGDNLSFYTLAIINSASVFGRIIPNLLADRVGPMNMIMPATLCSGIIALCLMAVPSVAPLVVVCALYGFFTGSLVSLPPTIFVALSQHKRHMIGTRMGMGFFVFSIGLLLGTPGSGWILDASGYNSVWIFSGVLLIAASALFLGARMARIGSLRWLVKV